MPAPNLLLICLTAFVLVMLILGLLAWAMSVLTRLFPDRPVPSVASSSDPAWVAVIHSAVASLLPGFQITHIQEEK